MKKDMPFILSFYNEELTRMISEKYAIKPMDALRRFLDSSTYRMLSDPELEMWEFSPIGIFDMWEAEQVAGTPQNSLYLRSE